MACDHPIDELKIDAGQSGMRGGAPTVLVVCSACSSRFSAGLGLQVLLAAEQAAIAALWREVLALGGKRRAPVVKPVDPEVTAPAPCEHYLSWLKVEAQGLGRGEAPRFSVRCVGCKESWPAGPGLVIFHERLRAEHNDLGRAVRDLKTKAGRP